MTPPAGSNSDTPPMIARLLGSEAARWSQNIPGGKSRQQLVRAAIDRAAEQGDFALQRPFRTLIEGEFRRISPDRADRLQQHLDAAFGAGGGAVNARTVAATRWRADLRTALRGWVAGPVWAETPFRRLLTDAWSAAIAIDREYQSVPELRDAIATEVGAAIESSFEAVERSPRANIAQSERFARSAVGFSRLADAALHAAREFAAEPNGIVRTTLAELVAWTLCGMLEGIGRVRFRNDAGRLIAPGEVLFGSPEACAEILGLLHIVGFAGRESPPVLADWFRTGAAERPMLEGFWRAARALDAPVIPMVARAQVAGDRIEFRIEVHQLGRAREELTVAIVLRPVENPAPIRQLLAVRGASDPLDLLLCRQRVSVDERSASTLLTQVPELPSDATTPNAERIAELAALALRALVLRMSGGKAQAAAALAPLRNYAKDFPLDEPTRDSRLYLVERPAVQSFVNRIVETPGTYLHCSLRRSGKTTAFRPDLLKTMGLPEGTVVAQTCRPNAQPESFYEWLRSTHKADGELTVPRLHAWFEENLGEARLLVLDEYESLFRWLRAIVADRPLARTDFVNPLLDGIVSASERWGFLFLGLDPGAARIFMEDNPLAPRLQSHPFPLFEHTLGSRTSEFARLVALVISRNLEIDTALVDRLAYMTGGHPHFAVSVLREFLSWTIDLGKLEERRLRVEWWPSFERGVLSPFLMQGSPHFQPYVRLHSEWRDTSESGDRAGWLRWTTRLVEEIGDTTIPFDDAVARYAALAGCDRSSALVPLQDAAHANFIEIDRVARTVRVRVPLYGRLASSWSGA